MSDDTEKSDASPLIQSTSSKTDGLDDLEKLGYSLIAIILAPWVVISILFAIFICSMIVGCIQIIIEKVF
jgi:hypothetical protein